MKIFLDTSALFKLYHHEVETEEIENIFIQNKITDVLLSEITKIEFASTVWKKVRKGEINNIQGKKLIELFESDFGKYTFIPVDNIIIEQANKLMSKYGIEGLRTLDSIQLSTAIILKDYSDLFKTTDKLLDSFLKQESLPT